MLVEQVHVNDVASPNRRSVRAAVLGNVLEWYDFGIYAFTAPYIAKAFFPSNDSVASLLSTLAVFGAGSLARPLGGILLGWIGDVKGRRPALLLTMLMMAASTVASGLIPDYATIGVFAPLLMLIARIFQGLSTGGESGLATAFLVEVAPEGRRGLYGSYQQFGVAAGFLLGSALSAVLQQVLDAATMEAWGWRLLFLFGGVLGPVCMFMRRHLEETPAFTRTQRADAASPVEMSSAAGALKVIGIMPVWTVGYYMFFVFFPIFAKSHTSIPLKEILWSNAIALVMIIPLNALAGILSDKVGRKVVYITGSVAVMAYSAFLFNVVLLEPSFVALVTLQIGAAIAESLVAGVGPALICEVFETRGRTMWMSAAYGLAVAAFGGFAPYIGTWLIQHTGAPTAPVYYIFAVGVLTVLTMLTVRETAHRPLR